MTVHWISERSDSRIGELGEAIVKEHRAPPAGERARHEYEVLSMLHAVLPPTFSVPRPLSLDGATLTIERATGTPLDVLIRDGKRRRDAVAVLYEPVKRAAQWLRAMQSGGQAILPAGTGRIACPPPEEHARRVFTGRMQRRVVARLQELAARVDGPLVGHHGDYWPGNVFIDTDRVQVIDFEGYREGHPLEDVAYFLLQLKLLMPRHQRYVPHLQQAFLEGYGGVDDHGALTLFTMTKTLHLLARNAHAKHSFLVRIWMRRTLRNTVAGCLR